MTRTALFILTSHDTFQQNGEPQKTGFHWVEMSDPYYRLKEAGYDITLASVTGGKPPADPNSEPQDGEPESVVRFQNDADAMAALKETSRLGDIDPTGFDIVYLPGGHGTMWDFRQTKSVGQAVSRAWAAGAVIGSVCHGPVGLLGATKTDGSPLVAGHKVGGFSNDEERQAGMTEVVPFLLETELKAQGASYDSNPQPFAAHVVRDGRLVTGQNPASAAPLADAMVDAAKGKDMAA